MRLYDYTLAPELEISTTITVLIIINSLAFLYYGYNCLFSEKMSAEFNRFKLSISQRKLTGILQITGALGLLGGFFSWHLGLFASLGLTLLMMLGFGVRIKVKDSFAASAPSFILMLLNGYFAYYFGLLLGIW